jgi:hypothetical protein
MIDRGERGHVRVGQRRVRLRQSASGASGSRWSDLEAFIQVGETPKEGDTPEPVDVVVPARGELAEALSDATAQLQAGDDEELAKALRSVARTASRLARSIERSSDG